MEHGGSLSGERSGGWGRPHWMLSPQKSASWFGGWRGGLSQKTSGPVKGNAGGRGLVSVVGKGCGVI